MSYSTSTMLNAAHTMIAASSIIDAIVTEYVTTGVLSVGALQHAGNLVDANIERLGLADLDAEQATLPF